MAIKIYKPTTPARRRTSVVQSFDITKTAPEKKLTIEKNTQLSHLIKIRHSYYQTIV